MNDKFDELAKGLAQSATRRQALKKFGVGLAGMALACFGLANKAKAATRKGYFQVRPISLTDPIFVYTGYCVDATTCSTSAPSSCGSGTVKYPQTGVLCSTWVDLKRTCNV